jgi:uncharacterized protein
MAMTEQTTAVTLDLVTALSSQSAAPSLDEMCGFTAPGHRVLLVGDTPGHVLRHIGLRHKEGLAALAVTSADGQAFRQPLEELAPAGVPVQVLGFREHASWALASDTLEFVDLEDITGVFREPLPRIGLDSLPEQGAWLQPFRPLSSFLTSRM